MPKAIAITRPHFNSYHHNDSLLFQFILSEFLSAQHEIKSIDNLLHIFKAALNRGTVDFKSLEKHLQPLFESITRLSGSSYEYMRIFSWNLDNGILAKLKNYCSYFSQNSDEGEKNLVALERYAHKSWSKSLQLLDISRELIALQKITPKKTGLQKAQYIELCETLYELFNRLMTSYDALTKILGKLIPQFRDDENVMFFVVVHHDLLDSALGMQFTANLLRQMYPKGILEASHFLQQKYAQRGFDKLLPAISKKVAEIESALL